MFAALLDTCVLWPNLQRDFLLSLAAESAYRPLWSEAVLDELEYHEATKLVRRGTDETEAAGRAAHLIAQMRGAFDDAIVVGWEGLDGSYGLPDPDDEHLVAAAVVGGAGAIVTENFRDLPRHRVPSHVQVLSAREFLADQTEINPRAGARAVEEIARRSGHNGPLLEPVDILDNLTSRYGLIEAVDHVRPHLPSGTTTEHEEPVDGRLTSRTSRMTGLDIPPPGRPTPWP